MLKLRASNNLQLGNQQQCPHYDSVTEDISAVEKRASMSEMVIPPQRKQHTGQEKQYAWPHLAGRLEVCWAHNRFAVGPW